MSWYASESESESESEFESEPDSTTHHHSTPLPLGCVTSSFFQVFFVEWLFITFKNSCSS